MSNDSERERLQADVRFWAAILRRQRRPAWADVLDRAGFRLAHGGTDAGLSAELRELAVFAYRGGRVQLGNVIQSAADTLG